MNLLKLELPFKFLQTKRISNRDYRLSTRHILHTNICEDINCIKNCHFREGELKICLIFKGSKIYPSALWPLAWGAATLGNAFYLFGMATMRHILIFTAIFIWMLALSKMILYFPQYKEEYKSPLTAGLYATFSMLMMIIGSYIYPSFPLAGTIFLSAGMILHIFFILCFTYYHAFKNFNRDLFVPSWFVTYFGILVAPIVGKGIIPDAILKVCVFYAPIPFTLIYLPIVWKGITRKISETVIHTKTIYLAPLSLCLVSYSNMFPQANIYLVSFLYSCILCALIYVLTHLKRFFSETFAPSFAALTFPVAIAVIAGFRAGKYFAAQGYQSVSIIIDFITEANLLLAAAFISYILLSGSNYGFPNILRQIM